MHEWLIVGQTQGKPHYNTHTYKRLTINKTTEKSQKLTNVVHAQIDDCLLQFSANLTYQWLIVEGE